MEATTPTKLLPLGLYFNLDAETYFADPGLGSTDLRRLAKNPFNYWYKSRMNPARPPDKETDAQAKGTAMHKLIFEGRDAFDVLYMRGPDQDGMTQGEKSASTKAANKLATEHGRDCLKAEDYDRVLLAGAMVTKNPHLATVFSGGCPEVSLFYEYEGVRLKCQFDYLKATKRKEGWIIGIGDLKSVANQYENDFRSECYNAMARYRYDAQAAHYVDGIIHGREMFLNDRPINAPDSITKLIDALKQPKITVAWQFIFHQSENAPITHSIKLSPMSPILDCGRAVIRKGIERYRECMEKFGPNEIWVMSEPPEEGEIEALPAYFGR